MKNLILTLGICLITLTVFSQDIPQSQVPSIVVNSFKQNFPRASDIEWELKGDLYEVEFEIGFTDHKAFYNSTGKLVKLKQDIKESELPAVVSSSVKKEFPGYRISDLEKIDELGTVTYKMEMKKMNEEWKVVYDANGKQLSKIAD